MSTQPMLVAKGLYKTFSLGGNSTKIAVNNLDLTIPSGQFVTVVGSNGAGKSTLLNLIAGCFPVESGSIFIESMDVTKWPEHRRAKSIGRVFQNPLQGTAANMSVEENLSMAQARGRRRTLRRGVSKKERAYYKEILSMLGIGLENQLKSSVGTLSGGQRQSLTLLMSTLVQPKLLLLDEHVAALDPKTAQQVLELTQRIVKRFQLATLMVTHNLEHALRIGDRTIMMHEGNIVLDIQGPDREKMSVKDMLDEFTRLRGEQLLDDRILLA
jgi:putative ABC transport system ATP-binding protein